MLNAIKTEAEQVYSLRSKSHIEGNSSLSFSKESQVKQATPKEEGLASPVELESQPRETHFKDGSYLSSIDSAADEN